MTEPPALRVLDLRKSFPSPDGGRFLAVEIPALRVEAGESVVLKGESGSGKTTLLNLIAGILPADAGVIEVAGEPLTGRSEVARDRLRARAIGYLFQTFNLLPGLTALENVQLGMSFRPRQGEAPRAAARQALERVGLADRMRHRPAQLSVGQQQRVAIARALAGRPALVLADEPTSNLDRMRADQCLDLLTGFATESGAALLVVTHDERLVPRFDRCETLVAPAALGASS
jgi:putative ABC transport system ATP-binding protein